MKKCSNNRGEDNEPNIFSNCSTKKEEGHKYIPVIESEIKGHWGHLSEVDWVPPISLPALSPELIGFVAQTSRDYDPTSDYARRRYDYVRSEKIVVDAKGCWIAQYSRSAGYSHFALRVSEQSRYLSLRTHRFLWEVFHGRLVSPDKELSHECPGGANKLCCNPAHLFERTKSENINHDYALAPGLREEFRSEVLRLAIGDTKGLKALREKYSSDLTRRGASNSGAGSIVSTWLHHPPDWPRPTWIPKQKRRPVLKPPPTAQVLWCEGEYVNEIGRRLGISRRTAERHVLRCSFREWVELQHREPNGVAYRLHIIRYLYECLQDPDRRQHALNIIDQLKERS